MKEINRVGEIPLVDTSSSQVSKPEELPLGLLSELYVKLSLHTAPNYTAVLSFQCANNLGSLLIISFNQFLAFLLEFFFLYLLLTHLIKHISI